MDAINIGDKLSLFTDHWNPRIVASLNENYVKLVKLQGDFIWHSHEKEDELFFVVKGKLMMDFRDRTVEINPGEFIVVTRGTEHRPHADEEVHLMLIEPKSVINTGDVENELTKKELETI
jgi:mannose-6-phosphate isomerase-like protein (cupin superfamily)